MDRRSFFRSALDKSSDTVGKAVVKAADAKVKKQSTHWIRPPFAINELEFLLACTRCGACLEACSYDVVFNLSARLGVKFAGTPALDLLNKGCHLCTGWPCVSACEANALLLPSQPKDETQEGSEGHFEIKPPKLAKASINEQSCLPFSGPECGACISSCPVDGALTLDMVKPVINEGLCTGCGLCRESCITEPKSIDIASL